MIKPIFPIRSEAEARAALCEVRQMGRRMLVLSPVLSQVARDFVAEALFQLGAIEGCLAGALGDPFAPPSDAANPCCIRDLPEVGQCVFAPHLGSAPEQPGTGAGITEEDWEVLVGSLRRRVSFGEPESATRSRLRFALDILGLLLGPAAADPQTSVPKVRERPARETAFEPSELPPGSPLFQPGGQPSSTTETPRDRGPCAEAAPDRFKGQVPVPAGFAPFGRQGWMG